MSKVLVGLAFLMGACGSGANTFSDAGALAMAASSSTTAVVAATTEVSELPDESVAGCEQLNDFLIGPNNFQTIDENVSIAQLTAILQVIDSAFAVEHKQIFEMQADPEIRPDDLLSFFTAMDEVTNDACGVPVYSATSALVGISKSRFCELTLPGADEPVASGEAGCVDDADVQPDELPCFVATGNEPVWPPVGVYRAADCDTDEPVMWDSEKGLWSTQKYDAFVDEMSASISEIESYFDDIAAELSEIDSEFSEIGSELPSD